MLKDKHARNAHKMCIHPNGTIKSYSKLAIDFPLVTETNVYLKVPV